MSSQRPSGGIVTQKRADNKTCGVAKTGGDATLRGALRSTHIMERDGSTIQFSRQCSCSCRPEIWPEPLELSRLGETGNSMLGSKPQRSAENQRCGSFIGFAAGILQLVR